MQALVGYTGFVGSNIYAVHPFNAVYNSSDIENAYGTNPDLLIYAGLRAEKYLANCSPEKDMLAVSQALENITRIQPKKLVLISTVDVYKHPVNVNEDSIIDINGLHAYGLNRYRLEQQIQKSELDTLIVRLPGLYGMNIKKNFIYDIINLVPIMLKKEKFEQLCMVDNMIKEDYALQDNGFFKLQSIGSQRMNELKTYFNRVGFSALNFTDSRAKFQFYPLRFLWNHISIALDHGIKLLNISVPPIDAGELYQHIRGLPFTNTLSQSVPLYDMKSKYADLLGGIDGYLFSKSFLMDDIRRFVLNME